MIFSLDLIATDADDILQTGNGADYLSGVAGADTLVAGAGDDTLVSGSGSDVLNGGADRDLVGYSAAAEADEFGLNRDAGITAFIGGYAGSGIANLYGTTHIVGGRQRAGCRYRFQSGRGRCRNRRRGPGPQCARYGHRADPGGRRRRDHLWIG